MVSTKKPFHSTGENTKDNHTFFIHNQTLQGSAFMNILNYKLDTTHELLTPNSKIEPPTIKNHTKNLKNHHI
jgi:hypothetical protein